MICAAAERGWIDQERAMMEALLSIRRAGAEMILTTLLLLPPDYFSSKSAPSLEFPYFSILSSAKLVPV